MENLTDTSDALKKLVREKYTEVAVQSRGENAASCCGLGGCDTGIPMVDAAVMAEDYAQLQGYVADADLGLGCGLPTEYAQIKEGDTVVDLGSGAGNDCFVARAITGEKGRVIGIDMTEIMIEKARRNAEKLGLNNVEFRLGDIEKMPVSNCIANVVVSNCVLNLVPDKAKAFAETFRILKPGGHFSVSDIVLEGDLPEGLRRAAEMYAGCVAGASQKADYLRIIEEAGFENIQVQKSKAITLPGEILKNHLDESEIVSFRNTKPSIYSITVYAEKPGNGMGVGSSVCC